MRSLAVQAERAAAPAAARTATRSGSSAGSMASMDEARQLRMLERYGFEVVKP